MLRSQLAPVESVAPEQQASGRGTRADTRAGDISLHVRHEHVCTHQGRVLQAWPPERSVLTGATPLPASRVQTSAQRGRRHGAYGPADPRAAALPGTTLPSCKRFGVYRCARPMAHHQAPVWPITEPLCVLVTRTGRGRRMGWSCCGLYAPATWRRGLWGLCTDSLVLLPAACRVHREQGAPVHHRSIDPTSTRLHGEVWMAPRRNGRLLLRAALVRSWAIAVYVCVSCMIYLYITACSVGGSIPDAVLDCRRKGAWSTDRPG